MKTKDAVRKVLVDNDMSMYRLAKHLKLQPIMIKNYIAKGTRMSGRTACKFKELYGITISDVYNARTRNDT